MNALVTGGGGFLGRAIVEQLVARGDSLRSFSRGAYPELEKLGVEVIQGDIADRDAVVAACDGMDCVFHVAAIAGIGVGRRNQTRFVEINREGTNHVIHGCREANVPRLVFTSSPSVVFAGEDQNGINEQTPYGFDWFQKHDCFYSQTKALAEQAVLEANSRSGVTRTCALRPHLIWGPRDQHLIPRLIERAKKGRLRRVGDGQNLVDMIYVDNAAAAHLQAGDALALDDSPVAGKAYFLSQGTPVNCWDWINEILALADIAPVHKSISASRAWKLGHLCERAYRLLGIDREPPMSRFLAAQLSTSHWYDISAAKRDFGYECSVSTEEGMLRLAEWLRSTSLLPEGMSKLDIPLGKRDVL